MIVGMLSTRVAPCGKHMRVLVTSTASMSSSTGRKKRESLKSLFAQVFGGKVDAANEGEEGIDSKKVLLPNIVDQATGNQKLMLLAFENGFLDPYCNLPTLRQGRGTKDNPVLVESFINERMVACICEESQSYLKYTYLHRSEPKRCRCGHWMKLVDAPRFWQKIPKEDLIEIPFFRDLEEDGKLDDLLAGKLDPDEERDLLEMPIDPHH